MGFLSTKGERVPLEKILNSDASNYATSLGEGNISNYQSNIKIKNKSELLTSLIRFVVIGKTPINEEFNNNELIRYSEKFFSIGKIFSHISIFLGFSKENDDYDGVCIEYGKYNKDDILYHQNEEYFVCDTGLKYTQMSLNVFIKMIKYYNKNLVNKNCILTSCNINSETRFDVLLQNLLIGEKYLNNSHFKELIVKDEILEEIENRYSIKNYGNFTNNCQDFASKLLKEIKANIINPSTKKKIDFKKLTSYLPGQIVKILKYNEENYKIFDYPEIIDNNLPFFLNINKDIPLIE